MKAEHINPFLAATVDVFNTMLNCKLTRGQPFLKSEPQTGFEVSGVIGLSGMANGAVVLSLCRNAAMMAAAAMLGEQPASINGDVCDAVGELTNMIAGSAKAKLEHLSLSVGLPNVVTGDDGMNSIKDVTPVCIPFESEWGAVNVEVGLIDQPA